MEEKTRYPWGEVNVVRARRVYYLVVPYLIFQFVVLAVLLVDATLVPGQTLVVVGLLYIFLSVIAFYYVVADTGPTERDLDEGVSINYNPILLVPLLISISICLQLLIFAVIT